MLICQSSGHVVVVTGAILAAVWVLGCQDSRERDALRQRIANTVEAAEIGRGQVYQNEWLRARFDDMITGLESATLNSLTTPTHVLAYAVQRVRDGRPQWVMYVRWISLQPLANGVRVLAGDDSEHLDFAIADEYLSVNEEEAQRSMMFYAGFFEEPHSESWHRFASLVERDAQVVLTKDGKVISDPHVLAVIAGD